MRERFKEKSEVVPAFAVVTISSLLHNRELYVAIFL